MGRIADAFSGGSSIQVPPQVLAAQRNTTEDEGGSWNPIDIVKHAVGDIGEFAGGLADLVGLVGADVFNLGKEAVTLGNADTDYFSDDIFLNLVGWGDRPSLFLQDLDERYGGASEVANTLQEDPLWFLADIAAVATMGGTAASAAASTAAKTAGVTDDLARLGKLKKALMTVDATSPDGLKLIDEIAMEEAALGPSAKFVNRVHPGRALGEADTPELQQFLGLKGPARFPVGGIKTQVSGSAGGKVAPYFKRQSHNPVRRATRNFATSRMSRATEAVQRDVDGLSAKMLADKELGNWDEAQQAERQLRQDKEVLDMARKVGITEVPKSYLANWHAKTLYNKLTGNFMTKMHGDRDQDIARLDELIKKHAVNLGSENIAEKTHIIGQVSALESPGQMDFPTMRDFVSSRVGRDPDMDPALLTPDEWVSVIDSAHRVSKDTMTIDSTYTSMEADAARVAQGLGAVNHQLDYRPTKGAPGVGYATFSMPDGRTIRFRMKPSEDARAVRAMDHLANYIDEVTGNGLKELKSPELQQLWAAGKFDEVVRFLDDKKIPHNMDAYRREILAARRWWNELSEAMVVSARESVDPWAHFIADLRVENYLMHLMPSMDSRHTNKRMGGLDEISYFSRLRERLWLPQKLERFGKMEPVEKLVEEALEKMARADRTNNKELRAEGHAILERLGWRNEVTDDGIISAEKQARDWYKANLSQRNTFLFDAARLQRVTDLSMADEFDAEAALLGKQTPIYFPHMDRHRVKPSDWTTKKSTTQIKKLLSTAPYKRTKGWQYMGDSYVKDPLDAYARRATQIRRITDTYDWIEELVATFGREITYLDEMSPWERVFSPDLTKTMLRAKVEIEDSIRKHLQKGLTQEKAFTEGFQEAWEKLERSLDEQIDLKTVLKNLTDETQAERVLKVNRDLPPNVRPMTVYAIPETVAKRIEMMANLQFGPKVRILHDIPINMWRTAVLAWSPRWVVYNVLGNISFGIMQGGGVTSSAARVLSNKAMRALYEKTFKKTYDSKFQRRLEHVLAELPEDVRFGLEQGFFSSGEQTIRRYGLAEGDLIPALAAELANPNAKGIFKVAGKVHSGGSTFTHKVRRLNEVIEQSFREASFLTAVERESARQGVQALGRRLIRSNTLLEKLAKEGIDETTARTALDEVNYFFNDYAGMPAFERQIIRRFLMPFWSFYKHTVKLISTYPFNHPIRHQVLESLGYVSGEMAEEFGMLPDWMQGSTPIGPGHNPGDTTFLNTRGANPFNNLTSFPESLMGGLSPFIKMGYEQATGQDMFTGKPFTSPDTFTPFGSDQPFSLDENFNVSEASPRPSFLQSIMSQFPQTDLIKSGIEALGGGTGARYGTGQLILDPDTGEPAFPRSFTQQLMGYFGVSTTDFNQTAYETEQVKLERAALIGHLRRMGIIPASEPTS